MFIRAVTCVRMLEFDEVCVHFLSARGNRSVPTNQGTHLCQLRRPRTLHSILHACEQTAGGGAGGEDEDTTYRRAPLIIIGYRRPETSMSLKHT